MKTFTFKQGSVEWMLARAGVPTASEFDALVSPTGKIRTGAMPVTYLNRKLAEKWIGGPLPGFSVWDTEQGKLREEEARPAFTLLTGIEVREVGFITNDDGTVGCSPDGMITETVGIEIKCPDAHTHVGYLMDGGLPSDYIAQVQGSMFVTGGHEWRFMSYHPKFPPLIITVPRDDEWQKSLKEALNDFVDELDEGLRKLQEINTKPFSQS